MIMWILHILCVIFFIPALIITIPLHLILNAVKGKNEAATPATEKKTQAISKEDRLSDRNKAILGVVLIIVFAIVMGAISPA